MTDLATISAQIEQFATSQPTGYLVIIYTILIWALVWKGLALWKSANKKQVPWFIALLILNTVGILEILYIFVFSKINLKTKKSVNEVKGKKTKKKK